MINSTWIPAIIQVMIRKDAMRIRSHVSPSPSQKKHTWQKLTKRKGNRTPVTIKTDPKKGKNSPKPKPAMINQMTEMCPCHQQKRGE